MQESREDKQDKRSVPRRQYEAAFKAQLIAECEAPGVTTGQVARRHEVNAELVRRWRRAARLTKRSEAPAPSPAFIPLALPFPSGSAPGGGEIRIEVRRDSGVVSVSWPLAAASQCGAWLAAWLQ